MISPARLVDAVAAGPQRLLMGGVRVYRFAFKPWLGNACRFEPTCSQYALTALERHGAIAGSALTVGRLMRCHPWCDGGCDEVPLNAPALFGRLGFGRTDAASAAGRFTRARPPCSQESEQ